MIKQNQALSVPEKEQRLFYPRAWLYYRCSADPQVWYACQCGLIARAKEEGYDVVGCTGDTYATKFNRLRHMWKPGLCAMQKAVRKGQVDVVIVGRLSQISQKRSRLRRMLTFFQRHGVCVHTTEINFRYDLYRHGLDGILL